MESYDSVNPYQTLVAISGDSPDDLVRQIVALKTPIKVLSITSNGNKQVAYVVGDIRPSQLKTKPKKEQ